MPQSSESTDVVLSMEDAIQSLGYGPFQQRILLAAGLCSASDAMEILLLSFLVLAIPDASPWLTSVVFVGAFCGTLLLGRLGDLWGRRTTFVVTAALVAVFGLLSAVCQTSEQLLVVRFMVGVGIGGQTVPFDTYSECLPAERRGQLLVYPSFFWTSGTIMVVLLAQATLGQDPDQWRRLCLACALPCVVATVVGYYVLPESPRWLLSHRKEPNKALSILREAAVLNGKDPNVIFPLDVVLVDGIDEHALVQGAASTQQRVTSTNHLSQLLLFPNWRRTLLSLWFVWACYATMYYGTVLMVTRIYSSPSTSGNDDFSIDYAPILVSAMAEVAGAFLVLASVDRVGRRRLHNLSFAVGGTLLFVVSTATTTSTLSNHNTENYLPALLLSSLVFVTRMLIFSGSLVTWIWTAELLPTELRSTGHSTANAAGRIGGFCAPFLVQSNTAHGGILLWLIAMLMVAVARIYLPETKGGGMGQARQLGMLSENHGNLHQYARLDTEISLTRTT